jgi:uncharacterized protein YidB (DUF937 family)/LysM repeat protein
MGVFDEIVARITGSSTSAQRQSRSLIEGLLEMLEQPGEVGLEGLERRSQQSGLGATVSSWIGSGRNQPITGAQLQEMLGASRLSSLSQRAGLSGGQGADAIAALLPELVNQLTPEGRVPERGRLQELGKRILAGLTAARQPSGTPTRPDFSDVQSGSSTSSDVRSGAPTFSDVQAGSSTAPAAARVVEPEIYTVVSGDSLSKIARRYYGDAKLWPRIFEANRDQIENPDLIRPGQKLRIPPA